MALFSVHTRDGFLACYVEAPRASKVLEEWVKKDPKGFDAVFKRLDSLPLAVVKHSKEKLSKRRRNGS